MAKKKPKNKLPEVNEPTATYSRPELVFFNSFEEMNEYDRMEVFKQSPASRIKETVELILRVYGLTRESLKKRKKDNTIYFEREMNLFIDKHFEFLQLLIKANVDFMLIGGYAVINHGYKRTTDDLDVWLRPDNANKMRLLPVLKEMGFDSKGIKTIESFNFTKPNMFFLYKVPERIDCLTYVSGVLFDEAFDEKVVTEVNGLDVPFINLKHLILTKISTERAKDKADIEELQKIQAIRKKKK